MRQNFGDLEIKHTLSKNGQVLPESGRIIFRRSKTKIEAREQKKPNSLCLQVKFHFPHLSADIIEASAFSEILAEHLLPEFKQNKK